MSEAAQYYLPVEPVAIGSAKSQGKPISDVRLTHTADGGEIEFVEGLIVMDDGLETAVYLSLFGGNERDSGKPNDTALQWWGNIGETDPAKWYRSETQHLLRSLPAITINLRRLEDAVKNDLGWMVNAGLARSIKTSVSIPALNRVFIAIAIEISPTETRRFEFREKWGQAA